LWVAKRLKHPADAARCIGAAERDIKRRGEKLILIKSHQFDLKWTNWASLAEASKWVADAARVARLYIYLFCKQTFI
jgi:hypothetical protein